MVITDVGKAEVAALIGTDTAGAANTYDYIAIGTGTTAETAADTALEAENQRAAGVGTRITTNVTNDTFELVVDAFTYASPAAITESGMFNDPAAGVMLCRKTFSAINVTADDTLKVTWRIIVSS